MGVGKTGPFDDKIRRPSIKITILLFISSTSNLIIQLKNHTFEIYRGEK